MHSVPAESGMSQVRGRAWVIGHFQNVYGCMGQGMGGGSRICRVYKGCMQAHRVPENVRSLR